VRASAVVLHAQNGSYGGGRSTCYQVRLIKWGRGNPKQELLFQLNEDGLKQALSSIHNTAKKQQYRNHYTKLKWSVRKFLVWESSNFEPEAKYPDIRACSYRPNSFLIFLLSSQGMQTMILRAESGSEFIEPLRTALLYTFSFLLRTEI
jgi:hypothetical protein